MIDLIRYTTVVDYVRKNARYLNLSVEDKDVKMLILHEATNLYMKEMELDRRAEE